MNLDKTFLIMDVDKCIDCDQCVVACQRRHGASRFARIGFQIGSIRIPTSCKNCEDPVCIRSCRIDGMTRTNHRFTQPLEICIGCGLCAKNCPFGAIRMISPAEEKVLVDYEPWQPADESDETKLLKGKNRKKEIWKCDGCANYKNRGCVFNCPTGALRSVTLKELVADLPPSHAIAILNYLSPAFLDATEKELVKNNKLALIIDEQRQIRLIA
jgi:Fe-S-cluster-containing hydrogenase component 2